MKYDSSLPSDGAGTSGIQHSPLTQAASSEQPSACPVTQASSEQPLATESPSTPVSSEQPPVSQPTSPVPPSVRNKQTLTKTSKSKSAGRKRSTRGKGKGKGKRSKKKCDYEEDDEHCGICSKLYVEGEQWISCDICEGWYHRMCVNLDEDSAWEELQNEDAKFTCPMCI